MDGAVFLTRVTIDDYKSIAHCDVRLGPLTYLIGPNGSGKSNFLDALRFVADSLNHSLDYAIRQRGGLAQMIRHDPSRPESFRVALELRLPDGREGEYAVRIGWFEGRPTVLEEHCRVASRRCDESQRVFRLTPGDFESNFSWSPHVSRDRLTLVNAGGTSEMGGVVDALTWMRFYQIKPDAISGIGTPSPEQLLTRFGPNIAEVLDRLATHDPTIRDRIEDYLRAIIPTLVKVEVTDVGPGRMLRFWQTLGGHEPQPFWATAMSPGTLRSLGILVAMLQANVEKGPRPSLVAIEEPESQVNPAVLAVLRDAMDESSACTQVLITTHSPDLLDDKHFAVESLLVVAADDGITQIGPLDEVSRDLIRRRLTTAGQLLQTGQVFPEVPLAAVGGGQ